MHTKTPWRIDGEDELSDGLQVIEFAVGEIGTRSYRPILFIQGSLDTRDGIKLTTEDWDNARFVHRAVNSHDDLVDALDDLLGPPTYGEREDGPHGGTPLQTSWEAIRKARAALERAKASG